MARQSPSKRLAAHVEREYEREGYSRARAKYIGGAVAGRIAREKGKARGQSGYHQHTGRRRMPPRRKDGRFRKR